MGRWFISWVSYISSLSYIVNYGILLVGLLRREAWKSPVKNGTRTILIETSTTVWTFRVMIKALPQISEIYFLIGLKLYCLRGLLRLMFMQQLQVWEELDLLQKVSMESESGSAFPPTYPLIVIY